MNNIHGLGESFESQEVSKRWNWGAFGGSWLWGIYNETYIALLGLIPGINLLVSIYLGFKGNELSWINKDWENLEVFRLAQKRWARFGWILFVLSMTLYVGFIVNKVELANEKEYILEESYNMIINNEEAISFIGEDVRILDYIRGSMFIWSDSTYSIIVKTERGKYWAAIRLDNQGEIDKIILSHYYVMEGFHEVIIQKED